MTTQRHEVIKVSERQLFVNPDPIPDIIFDSFKVICNLSLCRSLIFELNDKLV